MLDDHHVFPFEAPRGFVLYKSRQAHGRLPVIYWYPQLTPLDPHHVWYLSERQLETQIDGIVDKCMVHGDHGWAPHMGGVSTIADDKFNGPLQIEVYGMPNYSEFYKRAGLGHGGLLLGPVEEAYIFQHWFEMQKRRGQAPPGIIKPPVGRNATTA
ncbi:MAG: hypothetical protein L6R39_005786 [Caloplaca ligustica]|nr:MAG: hypothetical protein L6R39_005786 [Caloplaca ligustica]